MAKHTVYILVDEDDHKTYHYIGMTTQPPKKRVCDILSSIRVGTATNKSMLHIWIKELIGFGRRPYVVPVFESEDEQEARNKVAELVTEFMNKGHPIKNSFRGTKLCNHQGRPLKERSDAINK